MAWHYRVIQNLKENWPVAWKIIWGICLIFMWAVESLKICTLIGCFCPKQIKIYMKKYRRVIIRDNEEWCKVCKKLTFGFKNHMSNLVNFHPITQKSKNFTSMGYFRPKYMRFDLKKYRGVIFHDTEQWCSDWVLFVKGIYCFS